eukprot:522890-Hanusia_phi.AAC.1
MTRVGRLEAANGQLEAKNREVNDSLTATASELDRVRYQLGHLSERVESKERDVERAEVELSTIKMRLREEQMDRKQLEAEGRRREEESQQVAAEIRDKLMQQQSHILILEQKLRHSRSDAESMRGSVRAELEGLTGEVRSLLHQLDELRNLSVEASSQLRTSEERQRKQRVRLEGELARKSMELEDLSEQLRRLEESLCARREAEKDLR